MKPSPTPAVERVGDLEAFRQDPGPAQRLCASLGLPALPDVSGLDSDLQERLYGILIDIEQHPGVAEPLVALGEFHLDTLDFEKALSVFEHLDGPGAGNKSPPRLALRALALEGMGRYEDALKLMDRHVEAHPEDVGGHIQRARILDALEDPELLNELNTILKILPKPGELDAFRGDQSEAQVMLRMLGLDLPDISGIDPDGQRQFYAAIMQLRFEPHKADKYGLFGQLCQAQKFPELAEASYRTAIRMSPKDYEWHYMKGLYLESQGRTIEARRRYEIAGRLNPDYAPIWMQLSLISAGDNDAALSYANRYIDLRPDDALGHVKRAQIHSDREDDSAMQRDLERAQALGPIGKQGHRLLGLLYHRQGKPEDSRFHLLMSKDAPVVEMDDPIGRMPRRLETSRFPLLNRFDGLIRTGRYTDALEIAPDLLEMYPETTRQYPIVCGQIAECFRQLNQFDQAIRFAAESIRVDNTKAESHATLALALVWTGQFGPALAAAEEAVKLGPDQHTARYARGFALLQIAIYEKLYAPPEVEVSPEARVRAAADDLERAVEAQPLNLSYLVGLAAAQGMLGDFDRAEGLLTTALRISPADPNTLRLKHKAERRESFWPEPPATGPATAPATAPAPRLTPAVGPRPE